MLGNVLVTPRYWAKQGTRSADHSCRLVMEVFPCRGFGVYLLMAIYQMLAKCKILPVVPN